MSIVVTPMMVSLSKQLFLSPAEAELVRIAIHDNIKPGLDFGALIDRVIANRLEWSGSQNFLAGFIIGRLLESSTTEASKQPFFREPDTGCGCHAK